MSAVDADKLARWPLILLKSNFEVVHCAVIKQQAPDALLKLKLEGTGKTSQDEELPELLIDETEKQESVKTECFD